MQSNEYSCHNAQYCEDAKYMGELHVNMNGGGKATLGDQRRASHYTVIQAKVINSTKLTERHNEIAASDNTTDLLSSSMKGKKL